MINQREIREKAQGLEVPPATIDKDWVLGHVLRGMYELEGIRESLIFKGGTCLKKCYFPGYRFSEDLDFTSITEGFSMDIDLIKKLGEKVFENSGARLHPGKIRPQVFQDKVVGVEINIKYWGANHRKNMPVPGPERWNTKIKIDANWYEEIIFPVEERNIYHGYKDNGLFENYSIPCYSLKETLSEKLRALIQRKYMASRDYYDIWFLSQNIGPSDWPDIVAAFRRKCEFKDKKFTGKDQLLNPDIEMELARHWKAHLAHQVASDKLKNVEVVCQDLYLLFDKIF